MLLQANELKYALGRIIRGLGSSTVSARTGFYTALVALINARDDISVDDIFNHLEKELHKAGSNTKGVSFCKIFYLYSLL